MSPCHTDRSVESSGPGWRHGLAFPSKWFILVSVVFFWSYSPYRALREQDKTTEGSFVRPVRDDVLSCRLTGLYTVLVALLLLSCPLFARYPTSLLPLVGRDIAAVMSAPGALLFVQALGLLQGLNAFILMRVSSDEQHTVKDVLLLNAVGRLLFAGLAIYYGLLYITLAWLWVPVGIDAVLGLVLGAVATRRRPAHSHLG